MIDFLGSGALNLDLFFELNDLSMARDAGFPLYPGREISGDRETAERLADFLGHHGSLVAKSGGGSAANTTYILSSLGWQTAFLGMAGKDMEGDFVLDSMKGVDTGMVAQEGKSALCLVIIEKKERDRAMFVAPVDAPDLFSRLSMQEVPRARIVHLSSLVREDGFIFHKHLINHLHEEVILTLDPGEIYAQRGFLELSKLLKRTDILFLTEKEIEILTGKDLMDGMEMLYSALHNPFSENAFFKEAGGPVLVCKMGKNGARFYSKGLIFELPAEKVEKIVDNTGAGDAFNAGFLDAVLRGAGARECLRSGIHLAALSLSGYGRDWLNLNYALKMPNKNVFV